MTSEPAMLALLDSTLLDAEIDGFSARHGLLTRVGAPPVPIEDVAYVGFLRDARREPSDAHPLPYRLRLGGGHLLVMLARPADLSALNNGFYVWPVDGVGPFRTCFVYRHALISAEEATVIAGIVVESEPRRVMDASDEEDTRTGAMLVARGHVTGEQLAAALADQRIRLGEILQERKEVPADLIEAAAALQERKHTALGEILYEAGLVTRTQIASALGEQARRRGRRIGEILMERGELTEEALSQVLARKFNMPLVDLASYAIDPAAGRCLPRDLIERYSVLPIAVDGRRVTIALSDPLVEGLHDVLAFTLRHRRFVEVLARPTQLKAFVDQFLIANPLGSYIRETSAPLPEHVATPSPPIDTREPAPFVEVDGTVARLVDQIIIDGINAGASDIHVEPNGEESPVIVRFRVDGDCRQHMELPPDARRTLVARLKILADLDISERRKPQDGKIRFRLPDRWVELRVATVPTVGGNEDVVMRILAGAKPLPLDQIGLSPANLLHLKTIIAQPYGLVLCVGPTGSGKTTTLHSVLKALNTDDMKIWTAEDPVEITQAGLRQVQMQPKVGLDFAAALRAFLRADPDVIMVGEMRDKETASIAVEASLTGHLVLSTLHTNGAPETVTRLLDMGLEPFNFADALLGVLAQRLARRLCKACKRETPMARTDYDMMRARYGESDWERLNLSWSLHRTLWSAPGCNKCGGTGYKGRLALHELLVNDDELKLLIQRRAPGATIRESACTSGMKSLIQDGVQKVLSGDTDLAQVLSVCAR